MMALFCDFETEWQEIDSLQARGYVLLSDKAYDTMRDLPEIDKILDV